MHRPVDQECDLRNLGSIPTDRLNEDFLKEIEDLQDNVFAEEKRFNVDGTMLDGRGRSLLHLMKTYFFYYIRVA